MAPEWNCRDFPAGCRACGRDTVRHIGRGLCGACYKDPELVELAKDRTYEFPKEVPTMDSPTNPEVEPENDVSGAAAPEQEVKPSGETRPGSGGSPVTGPVSSPSGTGDERFSRLRARLRRNREPSPVAGPDSREQRPGKGAKKRVEAAESFTDAWTAIGGLVARTGHQPLGRFLQWQGPGAGEILDEAVRGTTIDKRLVQPAVKARGRLDMVAALVGPPMIILAIERDPSRASVLMPVLKSSIRNSLPTLLPAMKKAQARERKIEQALAEFANEAGVEIPPGWDAVDVVIAQMFEGFDFSATPPPQRGRRP